jgi:hypothetical protein
MAILLIKESRILLEAEFDLRVNIEIDLKQDMCQIVFGSLGNKTTFVMPGETELFNDIPLLRIDLKLVKITSMVANGYIHLDMMKRDRDMRDGDESHYDIRCEDDEGYMYFLNRSRFHNFIISQEAQATVFSSIQISEKLSSNSKQHLMPS